MKKKAHTLDDFYRQIEPVTESGCLIWTGKLSPKGYGVFSYKGKTRWAHRLAWEIERGTFPEGLVTDHLCRVRCCVNVNHLEAVTSVENVLRGQSFSVQNKKKTHCSKGHELIGRNVLLRKDRPTERECRQCHNDQALKYYHASRRK